MATRKRADNETQHTISECTSLNKLSNGEKNNNNPERIRIVNSDLIRVDPGSNPENLGPNLLGIWVCNLGSNPGYNLQTQVQIQVKNWVPSLG